MSASKAIRAARCHAGLTQAELARTLGTTQAAVSQLERPDSNPTIGTLEGALRATGHELVLEARPRKPNVDLTLVARQLRLTPSQRLAAFETAYAGAREVFLAGARARGELA